MLAGERPIEERHLSPKLRAPPAATHRVGRGSLAAQVEALERELISDALEQTKGNRTHAARLLGVTRQGFILKLQRLGLDKPRS